MKSLSLTFMIFLLAAALNAQDLSNQVVCSAGAFNVAGNNSMSLSWTLGELIISADEGETGNPVLSQGFQQSKLIISKISRTVLPGVEVLIYPNPAGETLNISLSGEYGGETVVFLIAPDGRVVNVDRMEPGVMLKTINIAKYKSGIYFLKVQNGDKHNVYKFIKL
jgi:hypothetical protein